MTNEQLVARIKAGENVGENMAQLYDQVKRFIHAAAWQYRNSGELEDLEQEGYLALYPAIDGYDPAQGVKFLTYAEYHIRQRMQRYLQMNGSSLRLPVHCLEKVQQYRRLCSSFQLEHGREPSESEIAWLMDLTLESVRVVRENACKARVGSLDAPVKGMDGGEDTTVGELIPATSDVENEIVEQMQTKQLCEVLWKCVDSLPGQQPEVLRMRYQEEMSLRAIGQEQGTTPEAVRQIHAKALRELRKPRYSKRLRLFLPGEEWIYSMGITGNGAERFNRTWTSSTERAALWLMEKEGPADRLDVATSQQEITKITALVKC